MRLYMKQKMFSLKQDFNIIDENQEPVYKVDGEFFAIGRKLHIIDLSQNQEVAFVKQKVMSLMPQVDVFVHGQQVTSIRKKLTFFKQEYDVSDLGWKITGDIWAHDYEIFDAEGDHIASISRKYFAMSDSYEFSIDNEEVDPVYVIAVVLAIDAVMDSKQ